MHLHDEQAEGVQEASHLAEDEMQEINHSAATGVTRVSDQEDDEMQLNNEAEDEALIQVINHSAWDSVLFNSRKRVQLLPLQLQVLNIKQFEDPRKSP